MEIVGGAFDSAPFLSQKEIADITAISPRFTKDRSIYSARKRALPLCVGIGHREKQHSTARISPTRCCAAF